MEDVSGSSQMKTLRRKRADSLYQNASAVDCRGFISFSIDTKNCTFDKLDAAANAIERSLTEAGFEPKRGDEDDFLNVCDFFLDPSLKEEKRKKLEKKMFLVMLEWRFCQGGTLYGQMVLKI